MPTLNLIYQCGQCEEIIDFDVDDSGRVAVMHQEDHTTRLTADGELWGEWDSAAYPHVQNVRWLANDRVMMWSFPTDSPVMNAVRSVSRNDSTVLPIVSAFQMFAGDNLIYCCYGEDLTLAATPGEIEFQIVSAHSLDGSVICGLADDLDRFPFSGIPLEVSHGCVTEDGRLVFLLYNTDGIWIMDPANLKTGWMQFIDTRAQVLAVSSLGKRLLVAMKKDANISFSSFEYDCGRVSELGSLPLGLLLSNDHTVNDLPRNRLSMHGTRGGGMAVSADGVVWRVGLD